MKSKFPKAVKVCLWSYDTSRMSIFNPHHRHRMIINIMNRGTKDAIKWMMGTFTDKQIAKAIRDSIATEWNRKSLHFWSLIYKTSPLRKTRFPESNENLSKPFC